MCQKTLSFILTNKKLLLSDASIAADEFVLTHRSVFSVPHVPRKLNFIGGNSEVFRSPIHFAKSGQEHSSRRRSSPKYPGGDQACFFCLDPNHLISDCKAWKQKHASDAKSKSVALMQTLPKLNDVRFTMYQPFLFTGTVSLSSESEKRQIRILRDTGTSHSFVLREMLPFIYRVIYRH